MKKARYPHASYHRLYDAAAGPLWSAAEGLPLDEDGEHYRSEPDFFEWWYFDAAFDNGYHLIAILHSALFNATDRKPTVDVRIIPPNGAPLVSIERCERSGYRAATDCCDVRIADCCAVVENQNRYTLRLRLRDVAADLVYAGCAPGWRPGTGYLFADEATGHFFKWVVPVPIARVTGTLRLADVAMDVSGVGYHDHNWGNFSLADAFSHWYWGRLVTEEGGVILGDVVGHGSDPPHVMPFLAIANERLLPDASVVDLHYQNTVVEPITRTCYPARLDVSIREGGYLANMSWQALQVLEALDFASPPFHSRWLRQAAEIAFYLAKDKPLLGALARRLLGKASYLRVQAQARVDFALPQKMHLVGEALYEIMQFE